MSKLSNLVLLPQISPISWPLLFILILIMFSTFLNILPNTTQRTGSAKVSSNNQNSIKW